MEIVKKLMLHMDKAEGSHYRDELLSKIIEICSQSNYVHVTNFEWWVPLIWIGFLLKMINTAGMWVCWWN